MKILTHDGVLELLKRKQGDRSLRQFASDIKVSAAFLSDVYLKRRLPGRKLLVLLNLEKRKQVTITFTSKNGK